MHALAAAAVPALGPKWMDPAYLLDQYGDAFFWIALAIGQLYILLRHYVKLLFYASQIAFFQGELAHASYTAAPQVVWPDSPAAESIANAGQ